ncbi:MAG: hypothetical protein SFU98_06265 [Leptospiraceae bacterium]|nr:hypothetical protein [Leptospiraceae bacterium]
METHKKNFRSILSIILILVLGKYCYDDYNHFKSHSHLKENAIINDTGEIFEVRVYLNQSFEKKSISQTNYLKPYKRNYLLHLMGKKGSYLLENVQNRNYSFEIEPNEVIFINNLLIRYNLVEDIEKVEFLNQSKINQKSITGIEWYNRKYHRYFPHIDNGIIYGKPILPLRISEILNSKPIFYLQEEN